MELYDWLLFLHVLSAFIAVAAMTALWGLVLATRPQASLLDFEHTHRFGRIGGALVGAGMGGALIFGVWLALDEYEILDGWIIASLVLWAVGGASGGQAGKAFESDPVAGRAKGIRLHTLSSVALVAILVLMIWKPGA